MPATAAPRRFVPAVLDPADWTQLAPLYQALLDRAISSPAELEKWLTDYAELGAIVDEAGSRRYIAHTCHTDDPQIKQRYMQFVEEIEPRIKPMQFELQKKFLASPFADQLGNKKYAVLARQWRADVELFRAQNVPLQTQIKKLGTQYGEICGAQMVTVRGEELTLQQANRFLHDPDRATRQQAWETMSQRRYQDRDAIDSLFDQLIDLRAKMAANAGLPGYRDYIWKEYKRFDYTPQQCVEFAQAIRQAVVPLVDELDRQRQKDLGVQTLRPWDIEVDPKNRPALSPFDRDDTASLVQKIRGIFDRMSPTLGADFASLESNGNLDLASRKGKQPGGYQCSLEEIGQPFIFMNAAGLHDDVVVLLHEGGHAFHCLASNQELLFLRSAPIEFCEVASMSMELLGADHYDLFYNQADTRRARRQQLERSVRILPWIATIDSFQHWIYSNPGHSRTQRTAAWLEIFGPLGNKVDWSGFEHIKDTRWQRQIHLFLHPFYYVEYGIAQLGALQLWVKSRSDPHKALANYRAALKLGGTRPLPELFAAAGIVFDFSEKTLRPLMDAVAQEIEAIGD